MGNLLGGRRSFDSGSPSYGYGPQLQCCDEVVDPISLLATIGAIAALALFLRQAVIDFMVMMAGRRRKRSGLDLDLMKGRHFVGKFNNSLPRSGPYQNDP